MIIEQQSYTCSACSSKGQVRNLNQDAWSILDDLKLFMLADGIGGHRAGEVASKKTVEFFGKASRDVFLEGSNSLNSMLEASLEYKSIFKQTNQYIYQLSKKCSDLKGMGTTLCFLHLIGNQCLFGHVGDSRIYRFRDQDLTQLTRDHSLQKKIPMLNNTDKGRFLFKNFITRSIGVDEHIDPFISFSDVKKDDVFLLCSDGLTDLVPDSKIGYYIKKFNGDMERLSKSLIYTANSLGGHDNITVIAIQIF